MKNVDTVQFGKALADETRQKIMRLCCCNQLSVTEIVEALDVAQPTVSHHLKVLKRLAWCGSNAGASWRYIPSTRSAWHRRAAR